MAPPPKTSSWRALPALFLALLAATASAANGRVISESLDGSGNGYTVLKVWGTPYEMGFAQGSMLPDEITSAIDYVKGLAGVRYGALRTAAGNAIWKPDDVNAEFTGMLDGIKSVRPAATVDVVDLKLANTFGDWSYACRSHSAWGSFVGGATRTLSTRRLDFSTIGNVTNHHVLVARDPGAGGMRWVNLAFPGFVASVTGVNEYGTLASIHDYNTVPTLGAYLPRSLLTRFALTFPVGLPLNQHLDAVYTALQSYPVMTGTFLNYYVPEGNGGVITCPSGALCNKKRVPQADFYGGQVLLTTNQETDGHAPPPDDTFMGPYYAAGGVKTLADHYGLMGHTGLHLLSVDYRGRGDMTIWFEGRVPGGVTPTVKLEWADLFAPEGSDGGVATDGGSGSDGGASDGGGGGGGGGPQNTNGYSTPGGVPIPEPAPPGCGCASTPGFALVTVVGLLGLALAVRRRRGVRE